MLENKAFSFKTLDANEAVAHVSYAFTDIATIYPITPSSVMAEKIDKFSASGKKNIFGNIVNVTCMQSEAGVAGAMHGSLTSGALTTTYTASQGLLLMIPNMYKMAGELLPAVIHVSSRTVATHSLSIFGDHSDIYACRQTGFAMLCSSSPQEAMDLAAVAHLSSIKSRIPFIHFFDGFRTSHEIQKIRVIDYEAFKEMIDHRAVYAFRQRALTPERPVLRGTAQNDDIFFQARESSNIYYDGAKDIVCDYLDKINKRYGTCYKPFNYYGDKNAESVIIAMGSVCETIEEVVDYLITSGEKVGVIKVHLYRPFLPQFLLESIPKTVKILSVLDRTKEPGSVGEPLYLDVSAAIKDRGLCIQILRGRYGLSSKDTGPLEILSVYNNMKNTNSKKHFTIGINDDVTNLSLDTPAEEPDTSPKGTFCCKFWGFGSDGTVSANKNSIKIIGDNTNFHVQAYFAYDSKKSGGLTVSHLRFGPSIIKSAYYVRKADFVACHNPSYINKYDMLKDLKTGGKFLLNCTWKQEELDDKLPDRVKREILKKRIAFYTIDGAKISKNLGLGEKIGTVLQAAFFKILNFIDENKAKECMKNTASSRYAKKGKEIIFMNHKAIEHGMQDVVKINTDIFKETASPAEDKATLSNEKVPKILFEYVKNIMDPINKNQGNNLPVSKFLPYVDGTFPQGSSAFEKRATAASVPEWNKNNCIQCNFCSYVCPHAVIRPAVLDEEEAKMAPKGMKMKDFTALQNLKFSIVISAKDCTNCGCCAKVCPGIKTKGKALVMKPIDEQIASQKFFDYSLGLKDKPEIFEKFPAKSVKGSQFCKPLLEFSGACAGCGQTPYAKLVTQLFGEDMIIANATGCSSIWGASSPSSPYTTKRDGKGPAWQNSLFEDNAEFAYGIHLAKNTIRKNLIHKIEEIFGKIKNEELKKCCQDYLKTSEDAIKNKQASKNLLLFLEKKDNLKEPAHLKKEVPKNKEHLTQKDNPKELADLKKEILENKEYLTQKSIWMFGGDGWAYDIGFGGLDHVLTSLEDINVLIFDTEVYSNTGGQASKATPTASCAQFAVSGKETAKKDLAMIFMSYEKVYVAQVALGANFGQCLKALEEAQSFKGPSVIIAYAPCISHGISGGMSNSIFEEKEAIKSGYWNLFRYDPRLSEQGKNPFSLDSPPPSVSYRDFIMRETRYSFLAKAFPERAKKLFAQAEQTAKSRYEKLLKMAKNP
ncbi:MAG: pyruvate:ferredoxin (flavodoxin) oxidoreductase [Oscillospiraceae bacterium]|jgi:pyruvate-ferredoxin/flavodoxin oxidoreductase|nr:pyruvate:ferredoxin (flavodoxin) oxidoreductase [Oscillospiraceae bacterium]